MTISRRFSVAVALAAVAAVFAAAATADSTPVGPLPPGPVSAIQTEEGQLVAIALPRRSNGRVWRIAGSVNPAVLRQVSEAVIGTNVVLVFRASGPGTTRLAFGLTRGETKRALESRRYTIRVTT